MLCALDACLPIPLFPQLDFMALKAVLILRLEFSPTVKVKNMWAILCDVFIVYL